MHEVLRFGTIVLVVAGGFYLAVVSTKLTRAIVPVPAPALFLLGAAVAAEIFPRLGDAVSIQAVERIGTVALIVILFEGGMHVGWRRFRASAVPITLLGVLGTFATAALMAVAARYLLGFGWQTSSLIGAALAPTDPAVMFSVLGNHEVGGRTATILEGESGANDPVGISLMLGLLAFATSDHASGWTVVGDFALQMAVGTAIGAAGGLALLEFIRRVSLPREGLYPLRTLAGAGVIYGVAAVAHGSGFLAVFVAGLLIGDGRAPYKAEIERFHASLASLGEITVFVVLGLTVDLTDLGHDHLWLDGIALAAVLAVVVRPLVVWPLLLPTKLRTGERLFVEWGGLKGAVPILLAALAILAGVEDARQIYGIVFVVVAFSVLVQGASIPFAAARLGVPMREVEPEPWDISVRLRDEPEGVLRYVVGQRARASGARIEDLPISERTWISMVIRGSEPLHARGSTVLEAGDEVLLFGQAEDAEALRRLFEGQ
jgi:cell volume regulation protein A